MDELVSDVPDESLALPNCKRRLEAFRQKFKKADSATFMGIQLKELSHEELCLILNHKIEKDQKLIEGE